MMKALVAAVAMTLLAGVQSQAHEPKAFECKSKLDYVVWKHGKKHIETVDFKLLGARSETNTLTGGLGVIAGNLMFKLNSPSHFLSENVISFRGASADERASLNFVFMKNSDGSYNDSNTVTVEVRRGAQLFTASNRILSGTKSSQDYPIVCKMD